jgi:SAM-dependent methyltransferase
MDLRKLCESNNYDFIFSIDVIEHISQNIRVFNNIYDALQPGGIFYLAMPYEHGHRYLLPPRYFQKYISWAQKEHIGEQYNLRAISVLLTQIGFDVIDARHTFGFWGKLAWEFDMLTENNLTFKHLLQPLMFIFGYLDTLWRNGPGSYAIRIIAEK